jgi:sugar O-acyltransferase (sialic acid O-acetyltransferase NeuD family)
VSASKRLFLFGASGHAKVVIDLVERAGDAQIDCVIDDDPARHGSRLLGHQVAGGRDALLARRQAAGAGIVAIGANPARRSVAAWLQAQGFSFSAATHPAAQLGREVRLGGGAVVMAGAVINADTVIGAHCIVNTAASVDHDCKLGEGVHVAPGARLCGGVAVGAWAFVGAGAVVVPGRQIGADAIIAAGAVVLADVPAGAVAAGNPARIVRNNETGQG